MQELAKAKARKMRMLVEAEADEAEALAKVRLEMVSIEAEEQLLACSESGSSIVALSKTFKTKSVFRRRVGSEILAKSSTTNRVDSTVKIERCPKFNFDTRLLTVKAGTSTLHLRRKLLTTVVILIPFFTKTKFDKLCRRVPLRNVNSRCCKHSASDNHARCLTCFVHL